MSTLANPSTIVHRIADWRFRLDQDGSLQACAQGDDSDEGFRLTPEITFALATFFRMPGVRVLLNRYDLERQHVRTVMEEL
jgi:hypothetical protein